MKKSIFLAIGSLALFLASCKKDDHKDSDSYHISYKLNGVSTTLSSTLVASVGGNDSVNAFAAQGLSGITDSSNGMGLVITDMPAKITANSYTSDASGYTILSTYHDGKLNVDYEGGTEVHHEAVNAQKTISDLKIVITSIDDKTARGTFSGDFYADGDPAAAHVVFTEGEFYLPVVKVN